MPESGETVRTFVAVLLSETAAREAERLLDRLRPLARCCKNLSPNVEIRIKPCYTVQ